MSRQPCTDVKAHRDANFPTKQKISGCQEISHVNVPDRSLPFGNDAAHTTRWRETIAGIFWCSRVSISGHDGNVPETKRYPEEIPLIGFMMTILPEYELKTSDSKGKIARTLEQGGD